MNDALDSWQSQHTDANGITRDFLVQTFYDETADSPWDNWEGSGSVSEWTTRDKRAGEWVLCEDRGSKRYFDAREAQKIALRDGWGYENAKGTKREIAAEAVKRDFNYLKSWCDDEWCYVYIKVTPLTHDGDKLESLADTLGCIESTSEEYIKECAHDLMEGISARMGEKMTVEV